MKLCSVENCNRKYFSKGYCQRHYAQIRHYGEIKKRTNKDPNKFIVDGNLCWIILYNRNCEEITRSKFYLKYYEQINNFNLKWHLTNKGYVSASWYDKDGQHQIMLHQLIIQLSDRNVPNGYEIDHKDGDPLNNLDENLRICTRSQNQHNRKRNTNNTSGDKGVVLCKSTNTWIAQIMNDGTHEYLGSFDTKEMATKTYNAAAIKYFGEFAKLNNN